MDINEMKAKIKELDTANKQKIAEYRELVQTTIANRNERKAIRDEIKGLRSQIKAAKGK